MKFILLFLIVLLIFAISVTLGANNDQWVNVNYMFDSAEFRLSTLLALLLGSGLVIGWLISAVFYFRLSLRYRALQRKYNKLQQNYETRIAEQRKSEILVTEPAVTVK